MIEQNTQKETGKTLTFDKTKMKKKAYNDILCS